MTSWFCALLAVLSIWDYPSRQLRHDRLRREFIAASREGDAKTMREICEKGVKLLPDDPTWQYNLACSLAYYEKKDAAFSALEKAIDLGFRDPNAIATDTDLKRLGGDSRFSELIEYARLLQGRPIMVGPMLNVDATGIEGQPIALGAQNMAWNFDVGCFQARLKLAPAGSGGNFGDIYMNRDGSHSMLRIADFPGLTKVSLDSDGRDHGMDTGMPNMLFPYPVFGNCSQAMTRGSFWRSMPRALMTTEAVRLKSMVAFYLSNQIWVYPANEDCPPAGKRGDVFSSVAPYWFVSAGISWSDQPILRAALEASRSFQPGVKAEIVRRGLLAPTIQTLVRKSLAGVTNETAYLSSRAHPTAIAGSAIDVPRLKKYAAALAVKAIPPLAIVSVGAAPVKDKPLWPEATYATAFASAFVLRSEDRHRKFSVTAKGSEEFAFSVVHDGRGAARLTRTGSDSAEIELDKSLMSTTNRVDLAVFGRNAGTAWGAPSFVSFAVVDSKAPYSDPALTPLAPPPTDEDKRKKP